MHDGKLAELQVQDQGEPEASYGAVQLSPDGHYLAFSDDDKVWLCDLANPNPHCICTYKVRHRQVAGPPPAVALSNQWLAIYSEDLLRIKSLADPEGAGFELATPHLDSLVFVADRLVIHLDKMLAEIDCRTGQIASAIKFSQTPSAFSPDGSRLAVTSPGRIKIYSRLNAALLLTIKL